MSRREKKGRATEIGAEEVRHLAELSKLSISAKEEEELRRELNEILGHFSILDGAKTEGLKPTWQTVGAAALREDVPVTFDATGLEAAVPRRKGRLVRAPRVF